MDINTIQNEIIEEFSVFDDWMDKYQYIIDLGKELQTLDSEYKKDEYLVKGCQSNVWVVAEYKDGKLYFRADSDAFITKGIIALLLRVFTGQTPEDILNADLFFIKELGLEQHLSMNRANGLSGMIDKIKEYARMYSEK